jgi:hypothetical protein
MAILHLLPLPKVCNASPLSVSPVSSFRVHRCLMNTQGYVPFPAPTPAVLTRAKRKQVKMAVCSACFHLFAYGADGCVLILSARIVRLPVSVATRHVPANDVKSMVSETHAWTACVKPERSGSSVVLTNVKANFRLKRRLRIQVSSYSPKPSPASHNSPVGFPTNGEGSWVAPSDQANGAPPGAVPAIPPQYLPPEGYWPYPYYPPPPGYVPPTPDGSANGDSTSHGQPPHHPAYYPIHPGYPAVPIYPPPPPGAYGPIPTPSGQAPPVPPIEQTAGNQTANSDDERPAAERSKKKKRAGGEDGGSKSTKKFKRATNAVSEAPAVVAVTPAAPPSDDSPDDHGSPVAHNTSGGVGGEPLPPVIAAA